MKLSEMEVEHLEGRIRDLSNENGELRRRMKDLEAKIEIDKEMFKVLKEKLETLENEVMSWREGDNGQEEGEVTDEAKAKDLKKHESRGSGREAEWRESNRREREKKFKETTLLLRKGRNWKEGRDIDSWLKKRVGKGEWKIWDVRNDKVKVIFKDKRQKERLWERRSEFREKKQYT